jgi:2-keto-3-deoxy-L-rhamnonate aldolase RhmA
MKNKFRQALLERRPSLGAWVSMAHPAPAEIYGRLGYEWVAVDLEHGVIDLESMTHIFRALDRFGCAPVARLPWCDPVWIKRSLDAGAAAVIVPMVNTAAQARLAVEESKYPPPGPPRLRFLPRESLRDRLPAPGRRVERGDRGGGPDRA